LIMWLKELRETKGLSQKETAKKAGISQQYYNFIENEKRGNPLNPDIAKKIAAVLDFDWTQFYNDESTGATTG